MPDGFTLADVRVLMDVLYARVPQLSRSELDELIRELLVFLNLGQRLLDRARGRRSDLDW